MSIIFTQLEMEDGVGRAMNWYRGTIEGVSKREENHFFIIKEYTGLFRPLQHDTIWYFDIVQ